MAALGIALAAGVGGWLRFALAPAGAVVAGAQPSLFAIAPGDGLARVARALEARGLIKSALAMRAWARWRGIDTSLKVGEYELEPGLSTIEIAEIFVSGRVRTHELVIPEGTRAIEIAARLEQAGLADARSFLEVVFDPASPERFEVEGPTLEGYLFPDTYRFARGLAADDIVRAMVDEFRSVYRDVRSKAPSNALSMRELTTLASIVEKETGVPAERPLIAAVFLNRMRLGMRLETDPTVIYGIEGFDGNLRRVHLEDESNPYNTYRIPGLPPGPIASPGRAALEAVLAPADAPYLFFVSRNDGTHVFSKSYREHARAVVEFQMRRRRR